MIKVTQIGDFRHSRKLLKKAKEMDVQSVAQASGLTGVHALAKATPKDSGKTASSWNYEIENDQDKTSIYWTNSNVHDGVNVAVLIDKGHGTGTGGYVPPANFIDPTLAPIVKEFSDLIWEEVTSD